VIDCALPNTMTLLLQGLIIASLVLMSAAMIGCQKGTRAKGANTSAAATSKPLTSEDIAPILLFIGTGTSQNDVVAIEEILKTNHLTYSTVNSSQLNEMSELQMRGYRLLMVPGGNFIDMGNSLTPGTATNIRNAVQNGLSYAGICAGAFLAGNSTHYNGFNLTSGVKFGFYAAENQGIRRTAVAIATAGAPTLDQYWEDGPQLAGWGAVVGKYPDGTPAVVEGTFGSGWVILSGIHPEAPESWRRGMSFTSTASEDNAYAGMLIHGALNRTWLSHY
jgi:Peptidase family S51